jgi:cytochrome c553
MVPRGLAPLRRGGKLRSPCVKARTGARSVRRGAGLSRKKIRRSPLGTPVALHVMPGAGPPAVVESPRKVNGFMNLKINRVKKLAVALLTLSLLALGALNSASVPTRAASQEQQDVAAMYTSKCAMCHGAKAEKKFNAELPEAEQVEAVLKGKKGEKPPFMPAYEPKGVNAEQAKALVNHMKQLKGS